MASVGSNSLVDRDGVRTLAGAAIRTLRDLIPWDGYLLSAWDAVSGTHRHVTLASEGYPPDVQTHMNDAFVKTDATFALLHTRAPGALRWRDLERDWNIPFSRTFTAEEILIPSGFQEGTTMCLRLPDGRYTGALHISWESPSKPRDEVRSTIEAFHPLLAGVCDLLRAAQLNVERMGPDAHAVVIARDGRVSDLPGRSAGPVLSESRFLRTLLARHVRTTDRRRYLWADEDGGCHRIDVAPCRGQVWLVTERSIPWPFGLSRRELEVLQLITEGYSNPDIAGQLRISPRTVSTHVEHILKKMDCQSRAQLAALMVRADLLLLDHLGGLRNDPIA